MAHTVLIVIGSGDIALSELLIRALDEPDITVIPKTNTESALAYIRSTPPDFIVASVTLAADRNSAADPGGGILFCEAARAICRRRWPWSHPRSPMPSSSGSPG